MAFTMSNKRARIFFDTDNICFGWEQVKYQWEIEDTRIKTSNLPQTELTKHSVFPDKWNKMRLKHAKAVFSRKTLSDSISRFAKVSACVDEIKNLKLSKEEEDMGLTDITKMVNIIVSKARENKEIPYYERCGISCMKFRAYFGSLYNNLLSDTDMKINRSNVNIVEGRIRCVLKYVHDWYSTRDQRKESEGYWGNKCGKKLSCYASLCIMYF